jgi:hypothetical protein
MRRVAAMREMMRIRRFIEMRLFFNLVNLQTVLLFFFAENWKGKRKKAYWKTGGIQALRINPAFGGWF